MTRVFIDLAENVAVMLAKDRKIVYYNDLDYSNGLLDELFAILTGLGVEEANVMLHGIISERVKHGDVTVANAQVKESYNDYKAIEHLFKALGVPRVYFYDFAGYWTMSLVPRVYSYDFAGYRTMSLAPKTLVVYQDASTYNFVVYDGTIKHTSVAVDNNLKQQVLVLCNKFELTSVVDADSLCQEKLIQYFSNAAEVNSEYKVRLARFAYMMTTDSEQCRINNMSIEGHGVPAVKPVAEPSTPAVAETEIDNKEKLTDTKEEKPAKKKKEKPVKPKIGLNRGKKKDPDAIDAVKTVDKIMHSDEPIKKAAPVKKKKEKKESSKPFGIPTPLCVFLILICAAIIIGSVLFCRFLESNQNKSLKSLDALSQQYQSHESQLDGYNRVMKAGDSNSIAGVSIADSIDFSPCSSYKLNLQDRALKINAVVKDKGTASKFTNSVKKKYKVSESNTKPAGKNTLVNLVIEVA